MNLRAFWGAMNEVGVIMPILTGRDRLAYAWALFENVVDVVSSRSLVSAEKSFMRHRERLNVRAFNRNYVFWNPDVSLIRELYAHAIYFPSLSFIPKVGDKVIDLGANVGLFSLLCASLGADVIAIDAQSGFAPEARRNFELNDVSSRVRYVSALVAATAGVFADKDARIASSHWGDSPHQQEISIENILSMTGRPREDGMPDVHLLKCDVEGSEFSLLDGDLTWLRRIRNISMEVHPYFGNVLTLKERLEQEGFSCQLKSSWREYGLPKKYPGYLFAWRDGSSLEIE